jgi:hypothetical protein
MRDKIVSVCAACIRISELVILLPYAERTVRVLILRARTFTSIRSGPHLTSKGRVIEKET